MYARLKICRIGQVVGGWSPEWAELCEILTSTIIIFSFLLQDRFWRIEHLCSYSYRTLLLTSKFWWRRRRRRPCMYPNGKKPYDWADHSTCNALAHATIISSQGAGNFLWLFYFSLFPRKYEVEGVETRLRHCRKTVVWWWLRCMVLGDCWVMIYCSVLPWR